MPHSQTAKLMGRRPGLIDVPDLARSWHRFRMITGGIVFATGVFLGVLWTWPGGYLVAGLSVVAVIDAAIRAIRPGRSPLPSMFLDVTLIGMAMVVVHLQAAGVGAPFVYMIVVPAFLLPWRRAALVVAYVVAWSALALSEVVMIPLAPAASPELITGIAYAIFAGHTVALVVVVAHALDRSHRAKDDFLAAVSHEIRTPLTGVLAWAAMLQDGTLDVHSRDAEEAVEVISGEAAEISGLVDDLLVAARLGSHNVEVLEERIDVAEEILHVLSSTRLQAFDVSVDLVDACYVIGDRIRTRQILRNLLSNAMRYGGPNVRVESSSTEASRTVTVTDDGTSLHPSEVERIFDPYVQAHTRRQAPEGIGLGLPISRSLARLMGGDLHCIQNPSETRFALTLPIAQSPRPDPVPGIMHTSIRNSRS